MPRKGHLSQSELYEYIARQYDDFQHVFDRINKERRYLNYGYTTSPDQSYEDRQEALCLKVFELAQLEKKHIIVDVGFGSGEQDFLLARKYSFQKLIGYNIAPAQVRYARERSTREGLSDLLDFREGKAEELPGLGAESVDRMLAIECAFYFDRPRFYERAAQVLRRNGLLVLADITFSDRLAFVTRRANNLGRVSHLSRNRELWQIGFDTVSLQSIARQTRPGAAMTVREILKGMIRRKDKGLTGNERSTWLKMALNTQVVVSGLLTGLIRYDLIVLRKR
ncbi:MAG: methyltransferase domain-containing protein [Spirochaetales bacterium]|nr:methyltransferase domain-containing protein [Spirochaetales bacterium]